ncbi:MAG: hypothetical protein JXB49_03585 [Bacteroidales bacterium]|nr:hypothetical protein [Bacteroidales bacterium]
MNAEELNHQIRNLVKSSDNMQEFTNLASPEENWRIIDKKIALPRNVGFTDLDCPSCFEPVRLIYEKFAMSDYEIPLSCPHCQAELICVGKFTGCTNEVSLKEK